MSEPTPELPLFTDGASPTRTPLSAIRTHLLNLYTYAVGGFRRSPRPVVALRVTAENREAATGTPYAVPFDVADVDTDDMWAALSPGTMWINTDGLYLIGFHARLVNNTGVAAGSLVHAYICQGGTDPETTAIAAGTAATTNSPGATAVVVAALTRGTQLRFVVAHNAGLTLGLPPDFGSTRAWAVWLGP